MSVIVSLFVFIFFACFVFGLHRVLTDCECDTYVVGRTLTYRLLCARILSQYLYFFSVYFALLLV